MKDSDKSLDDVDIPFYTSCTSLLDELAFERKHNSDLEREIRALKQEQLLLKAKLRLSRQRLKNLKQFILILFRILNWQS